MPIIARKPPSNFKPAPEGLYQAVCCDVWEPFQSENPFKPGTFVDQTRIVWQLDQMDDEGVPFQVSQIYRLSLHEKSNLCKHLEAWRGRKFTSEEKRGFDLEKLIGVNCQLQVVHNIKESGDVYANVQAIVPLGKGMTQLAVGPDFVRRKDRNGETHDEPVAGGEDVPF